MAEDLLPILTRFHRDVLLPDVKGIVGEAVSALEGRMNSHFDALYQRLDRIETEYHMLVAGLKRVEERLDRVEERLDRVEQQLAKRDLQVELAELKARMDGLQGQIRVLEERLSA